MEYFRIIQTLCRIGLGTGNPAFRFQVERLAEALQKSADKSEAESLEKLLRPRDSNLALKPSRLVPSTASFSGEELSPRVAVPVDKESSAPLAEIHFPHDKPRSPILNEGLDSAIERLIEDWSHVSHLTAVDAVPSRTCLLFGTPGTGKTRLAFYIGERLGIPMVVARLDGLISSFLGTTARNIGSLFEFADRYRCLLLLDEFDALAKLRDDPHEVGEIKRVVNALLQNIDRRSAVGFTIAVTNHETLLDPAVWRRFEIRINVPVPQYPERRLIIEHYLKPLSTHDAVLKFLGWITKGMTGSDLETMARSIKRFSTIHGGGELVLIEALRAYALTNASAEGRERIELLLAPSQEIARRLLSTPEIALSQQDVAQILGKDQTTISRWLKNRAIGKKAVLHAE